MTRDSPFLQRGLIGTHFGMASPEQHGYRVAVTSGPANEDWMEERVEGMSRNGWSASVGIRIVQVSATECLRLESCQVGSVPRDFLPIPRAPTETPRANNERKASPWMIRDTLTDPASTTQQNDLAVVQS